MLSPAQKRLVEVLAEAWGKRPKLRLGQLIDESSFRFGLGEPSAVSDEALMEALIDFAGLKKP